MTIFGDLERLIAEDLYPYRWPITIAFVLAIAAAAVFAYRMGWHMIAWRHKLATGVIAAVLLAVAIPAGDYLLSPLWERSHLEEESPLVMASDDMSGSDSATPTAEPQPSPAATDEPTPPFEPRVTHSGEFSGADDFHFGRGKALLIETEPGVYTLRFEEFSVRNGPDLFVYLSTNPNGYSEDAVLLGELKGTDGAFNYDVPPGTDVSRFKSAVVWCKSFAVLFATATLA